jgi:hypothetical protein
MQELKPNINCPERNPLTDPAKQDYEISGSKIVGEFLGYQPGHVDLVN